MGLVYADIELINGFDLELARRHMIGEDEVKSMHVNMLVDTGSIMLAINENIQEQLQLPVVEKRRMHLASGKIEEYDVVAPVELRYKNIRNTCSAVVLPDNSTPSIRSVLIQDGPYLLPSIR